MDELCLGDKLRDRLLNLLAELVWRRPWMILIAGAALAIVCGAYAWTVLRLNANQDDLIAPDRPFMADYRRFLEEFGDLEYIIVAVDASRDRAAAEQAVDRLLTKLRAIEGLPGVHGTIEPEEQLRIATRAMSDEELRDLVLASGAVPALRSADTSRVIGEASDMLQRLITGGASMQREEAERIVAAATLLLKSVAASQPQSESRRELSFLIDGPPREYLRSDSGRLLFINILPVKDYSTLSVIAEPIARIRAAINEVGQASVPAGQAETPALLQVDIGLTGKPVLQYDEMATSNADMTRASIIAFMLCAGLFIIMMRGWRRPVLAVIAFGMAAAWTYGFATIAIGQLNLLSIVFMLVLVGVGLDYGVHVIARYQEFRRAGEDTHGAIRGSMLTAARGNITGALTSSIVFFMAFFTTFQGLRELGLIAGGGLILCLIAMILVLPALLAIVERRRPPRLPERPTILGDEDAIEPDEVDAWFIRHARGVLIATIVVTAALIIAPGGPRFEFNLLQLQARGLESVEWERRIIDDSSSESWFGAVIAEDQAQALAIIERARDKPTIGVIRSVFDVIRPDSPQRAAWRAQLQAAASAGAAQDAETVVPPSLTQAAQRLEIIARGAAATEPEEAKRLSQLANELNAIDMNDAATRESVMAALAAIASSLAIMLEGDRLPLRDALPAAVRDQFVSPAGRYLVMLHPKEDVWEYEPMRVFVADLRAVDSHVTGTPITHFESLGEMLRAFIIMSLLALLAIMILLGFDFRSVMDVILALVPLLIGLLWTVELMGLLGVSFNLANFFAVPMLIGLGVDAAVHILHRYHEGGDRLNMGYTRRAVILTALTTIIGFGALIIAQHRGLRSLGLVMAIGSTACMLSSIIILPALLARREMSRKGHA